MSLQLKRKTTNHWLLTPLTYYHYQGTLWVKPREIATILKIKQPFQFTADIKELYGESCYIKGKESRVFRIPKEDDDRTVFIRVDTILAYFERYEFNHKLNYIMLPYMIQTLTNQLERGI